MVWLRWAGTDRATQRFVYDSSTKRLVMDFMNGFNATVIVYGQTGSGKSHSMFGASEGLLGQGMGQGNGAGIVPRVCEEVLQALRDREKLGVQAQLAVSYIEVFGNEGKFTAIDKYPFYCMPSIPSKF